MDIHSFWAGLLWPLIRLLFFVSVGLFIANVIEALNWTRVMAKLAQPLIRAGNLKDISGASFSMAFFSGVAANSMLAEAYEQGRLSDRELVLANLFNSLPTYFLHLPTMLSVTMPFLGIDAVVYVSLTLGAAVGRTACIVALGRLLLPRPPDSCIVCRLDENKAKTFRDALRTSWKRFKKRIRRILLVTLPIYVVFYFANRWGVFAMVEQFLTDNVSVLSFLPPKAMSIVVFQLGAEFTAGLAAAGALLEGGGLAGPQVVMALMVGNVLSSPVRAFRHQFPYYAGIFPARTALKLIVYSQAMRAVSVAAAAAAYYLWCALC